MVKIVVVSADRSAEEIAARLGIQSDTSGCATNPPIGSQYRRHVQENVWELCESGADDSDISELLERLYERSRSLARPLTELRADGCKLILRIVLHLLPEDTGATGFVIDGSYITWLASVGIDFIDVDQYVY
jgi:hypothetical protein